jgi:hypothetical protein
MSNNPIMDEVEMDHHHQALPKRGDVGMDSLPDMPDIKSAHVRGFMGDLFAAQNNFIQAQHRFLTEGDLNLLAGAQFQLIQVQYDVIRRLGCFE